MLRAKGKLDCIWIEELTTTTTTPQVRLKLENKGLGEGSDVRSAQ